ncbi:LysR substrate-binding domain-containing protein [Corticimicrobacter populi]|uniref:Transcriptional regulator LrhA n=1 Tax=Corticimicrobacter populi TaxID=2175229 RepID=A0A2V1JYW3_9BURK|nr:LysR substrate-binding domain-containing protein [Corticimicrobacter populi]PWF21799.1 transcriptional regulator LrhA [Corticimicrobacter populi]QDQ88606.1 transcriptional regulator LrhA [Alcaligenaceae bacterium SJ-26]
MLPSQKQTLDLELLRSFVAIHDGGTFAAAGQALGYTQAAITQHMQRLELQIGRPLFLRTGRTKQLSEHGRQLLRYARELLNLNDDALRSLADNGLSGSLRIGSPHDIADTLLPPLLSHIARSAPNLQLDISVGRSPFLMEELLKGELDLTISTRQDPNLEGIALHTSPTLWICSSRFSHTLRQPLPLVLISEPSIFRRLAVDTLEQQGIAWRQAYVCSNLIGIKAAVRAGLGITARSMELLGPDMRVLGEQDGLPRLPDVTYYLWIRRHSANPVAREAFELIRSRAEINPQSMTPAAEEKIKSRFKS